MNKFIIVLFWILVMSCSNDKQVIKECKHVNTHCLITGKKTLDLELPKYVNTKSRKLELFIDSNSTEFLYYLDDRNNFLVYNLDTEKLDKEIRIPLRGPDSFGKVQGFKVLDKDSILITPAFKYSLGTINLEGKKTGELRYNNEQKFSKTRDNNKRHIFITKNDIMYMPMFLEGNWLTKTLDDFKQYKTTLQYDIRSGERKIVGLNLPFKDDDLKSKRHFGHNSEFKNRYIMGFNGSHNLYVTTDFVNFECFVAKSENINQLCDFIQTEDYQKNFLKFLKQDEYNKLLWDPYREVLYRFYSLADKNITKKDNVVEKLKIPRQFGIMILDKNLNILGDQIFPENTYVFLDSFVTEDGLYISTMHPLNSDINLDYVSFELFKLIENNDF